MISTLAVIGGGWLAVSFAFAVVLGRAVKRGGEGVNLTEHCTCGCELADWTRENTDILGDVDARFWVIADDLRRTA